MRKIVRPGTILINGHARDVYCKIEITPDKTRTINNILSISGVEGPMVFSGDCHGSCGQIVDRLSNITNYGPGWDNELVSTFQWLWKRWHLNDMRAACEHQREMRWNERPIDPTRPLHDYGKFFSGQKQDSWNMLAWVRPSEHPDGLLAKPCPFCGYRYGTRWQKEELPRYVIDFIDKLPACGLPRGTGGRYWLDFASERLESR